MNPTLPAVSSRLLKQLFVGLTIGLGASWLLSGDPVAIPAMGSVPGALAGAIGLAVGGLLYYRLRQTSDCGCGDGCGC